MWTEAMSGMMSLARSPPPASSLTNPTPVAFTRILITSITREGVQETLGQEVALSKVNPLTQTTVHLQNTPSPHPITSLRTYTHRPHFIYLQRTWATCHRLEVLQTHQISHPLLPHLFLPCPL
uniref:Uncharacterized protein n=1 Tax=Cacopsylla melanoneura TaxID=428564 RepID=A0A8D9ALT5_9HEMI